MGKQLDANALETISTYWGIDVARIFKKKFDDFPPKYTCKQYTSALLDSVSEAQRIRDTIIRYPNNTPIMNSPFILRHASDTIRWMIVNSNNGWMLPKNDYSRHSG